MEELTNKVGNLVSETIKNEIFLDEHIEASLCLIRNEKAKVLAESFLRKLVSSGVVLPHKNDKGLVIYYDWNSKYKRHAKRMLKYFFDKQYSHFDSNFSNYVRIISYFMNNEKESIIYSQLYHIKSFEMDKRLKDMVV